MTKEIKNDKDVIIVATPEKNCAKVESNSADGMLTMNNILGSSMEQEVPSEKINEFLTALRSKNLKFSFKLDKQPLA